MSETTNEQRTRELFDAGAHYGYTKTRRHPSIIPYIHSSKNRGDFIDLGKTAEQLRTAEEYIGTLVAENKTILFIGTKPEIRDIVSAAAEEVAMPYVDNRWVGGTLTNFKEIRKRAERLLDLEYRQEHDQLVFQTKKEKLLIEREIAKLKKDFGGITQLKQKPDAVIIVDTLHESIATKEANRIGVPVVGINNTDNDIDAVDYPIVANDDARPSVSYIIHTLRDTIKQNKH